MTCTTRADQGGSRRRCSRHPRRVFQGAHVTVAQRVEDELQLTPCRSHGADVAAAAVGDSFPQHADRTGFGNGFDRLDRCPADQAGALFGDPPPVDVVSDSWCLGVSPAQHVSFGADANLVTSPISATNAAARVGPIPGMFWTAV